MQPEAVIDVARKYLGVRFRHQGRSKEEGLDCLGLLICISHDLGLNWQPHLQRKMCERDYSHTPNQAYLKDSLEMFLAPSEARTPQPAEVVLMNVEGRVQHLGVLAQQENNKRLTLIHAYAPTRKVVEHHLNTQWEKAVMARYVLPQMSV